MQRNVTSMMKRMRELGSVRDEDDEDSCTSAWNERSFAKKSRWMPSEASQRDSQTGNWSRDSGSNGPYVHATETESNQRPGIEEIQDHETATPAVKSRPFLGFDLQMPAASESPKSGPQAQHGPSAFGNSVATRESEVNSTGKHPLARSAAGKEVDKAQSRKETEKGKETEKAESGKEMEQTAGGSEHEAVAKVGKRIWNSAPALLLYSRNSGQDAELHSVIDKQVVLLDHAEQGVRLEAISFIGSRVELIKERGTRKLATDALLQQLWKEQDSLIIQSLVKVLCSVAVSSCIDGTKEEKEGSDDAPPKVIALDLLKYTTTRDVRASPIKSGLKVQILRSLYLISKAGGSVGLESFGPFAKEQLGSSNPRLREWGIRLLVLGVGERNTKAIVESRHLGETRVGEISKHVRRMWAEGDSLMHTLLEYTRDPYPSVREAVVWGILKLHANGFALKNSTYKFTVALLRDSSESVRTYAIKLVGVCVKTSAWDILEGAQAKYIDNAFLQICNMMTDMIMSVRQEACNTLAEMTGVSDNVLLQSLTKKVLTTSVTEKESSTGGSTSLSEGDLDLVNLEENKLFEWSSAGAFVVGLEDEFWEVRSSAIKALAKLGETSEKMAHSALELIVDMINDDSSYVRQQTIEALTNLALAGRLSITEAHLHMFLGILEDSNVEMRKAGHGLLSVVSLPSIPTFQQTIRAVFKSFEKHPQDEEILLITLENLGKRHSSHTEFLTSDLVQELRGLLNGESGLDEPRCIAVLVLLLAAATSNENIISLIPTQMMSLSNLLGSKLSGRLPLLQVLPMGFKTMQYSWSQREDLLSTSQYGKGQGMEFVKKPLPMDGSQGVGEYVTLENRVQNGILHLTFETGGANCDRKHETVGTLRENQGIQRSSWVMGSEQHHQNKLYLAGELEILKSTRQIVTSALDTQLLLEIMAFKQVLQRLRKELNSLEGRCLGLGGTLSFCGLFLQCVVLMVQLRANFVSQKSQTLVKLRPPQSLLDKLGAVVKHLLHRFIGFNFEQILQIYELHALVCVWKLALHPVDPLVHDVSSSISFLELKSTVKTVEDIVKNEDLSPSLLFKTVQEQLLHEEQKANILNTWRIAREVALSYWPCQLSVEASVKEIWADMKVSGSDFDRPLGFVPGLPVGIPINATVHNIPDTYSLWIKFVLESCAARYQLVEVEESSTGSASNIRCISTLLQLEEMPVVASSVCRICIVLEGIDGEMYPDVDTQRGPKGFIVPLCAETEVHLALIRERGSKQPPHSRR